MALIYKLESCYPDLNDDMYTSSNLSAYLNKYINICGGCYKVLPASGDPFLYIIEYTGADYDTCQECYGNSIDADCDECPPSYTKFALENGDAACRNSEYCEIGSEEPLPGQADCGKIDFFFYLDNSGSISDPNWVVMLNGVISAIDTFNTQNQFANGSLRMGISWFNSCNRIAIAQELTGDYLTVKSTAENLRDNRPTQGSTFPYYGFILTYDHITDTAYGRDDADKIVSFVSDGGYGECPGTTLQPLIDQMKAGTYSGPEAPFPIFPSGTATCCANTTPFEIRFISVGIGSGISQPQLQAIASSPNGLGQGNFYIADTFEDFTPIAQDIANSLVCLNPLPTVAPGYSVVPVGECCYRLTNCETGIQIYSNSDLAQYVGQTVNISGQDGCFTVVLTDLTCENAQEVTVTNTYGSCEVCLPSYKLYNCKDLTVTLQTANVQFETLLGKTVKLVEYPVDCWQVGPNEQKTLPLQSLTPSGQPFETCIQCDPEEFGLKNCVNGVSVLTTVDLSAYVGKVIKVDNFPGLCFTVDDNPCDCLEITLNNQVYTINRETNLFNGRPYFQFSTINNLPIVIAYDSSQNRWEAYNPVTQDVYFYSNLDIECPTTSLWIKLDPSFPGNITTQICPLPILNISPTEEFDDCKCCVNC